MIDLAIALRRVIQALEKAGDQYIIVGSMAAGAWGVIRATRDVDIAAMVSLESLAQLVEDLSADDLYAPILDIRRSVENGGSFNVLHPSSGGKVDVFVCKYDNEFENMRLKRRIRLEVLGVPAWVASPEDVVLAKLKWRESSRSETQWRDCIEIASTQVLDLEHMRQWATHLQLDDDLEDLILAEESNR